jgi:hypothetical protein
MNSKDKHENPWLGLLPYDFSDKELFNGRSQEIKTLVTAITNSIHTVIYGPSGVGKTSIIRAGIAPQLLELHYLPVYIRLDHSEEAPSYVQQITQALTLRLTHNNVQIVERSQCLDETQPEGLWEFLHRNEFWSSRNYLITPTIIIDQFEEIFTLVSDRKKVRTFFEELGNLCGNTVPRQVEEMLAQTRKRLGYSIETNNYRIILSLREDFLARFEEHVDDMPVFRRNRFSLQAMNGEQALEAVVNPGHDIVDTEVAELIVRKLTAIENKQLATPLHELVVEPALLSLFCRELNNLRISKGLPQITFDLVQQSGTDIIKDFYAEAMESVEPSTAAYLEDALLTALGFRNTVALDDITARGISEDEIKKLVEKRLLRFEVRNGIRRVEFTHDVLTIIARDRRDSRKHELELQAERAHVEELKNDRIRQKRKTRNSIILNSVLFSFIIGAGVSIYFLFFYQYSDLFENYVKKWGFPEGIGQITKEAASHRDFYYKLTRKGMYTIAFKNNSIWSLSIQPKHYETLEVLNGYGKPTAGFIATYFSAYGEVKDEELKDALESVCRVTFSPMTNGDIGYEMAYDKDSSMMWGLVYTPRQKNGSYTVAHFIDSLGFLMHQKSGTDYLKISYNDRGFEKLVQYFDNTGRPAECVKGAFALYTEFYPNGLVNYFASLDEYGYFTIDSSGNAGMRNVYDNKLRLLKSESIGPDKKLHPLNSGIETERYEYDVYGNVTSIAYFDLNERPCLGGENYHKFKRIYNSHGKMVYQALFGVDGQYIKSDTKTNAIYKAEYDERGNLTSQQWLNENNEPSPNSYGYYSIQYGFDKNDNEIYQRYIDANNKVITNDSLQLYTIRKTYDEQSRMLSISFYDKNDHPRLVRNGDLMYHKRTYEYRKDGAEKIMYSDTLQRPILQNGFYSFVIRKKDDYLDRDKYIEYFDSLGHPAIEADGYIHKMILEPDKNSYTNNYYLSTYGICGKQVRNKNGIYVVSQTRDCYERYFAGKNLNESWEPGIASNNTCAGAHEVKINYLNNKKVYDYYDEYENKIEVDFEHRPPHPSVVYLRLTSWDGAARKAGIEDGDYLVGYNSWRYVPKQGAQDYSSLGAEIVKAKDGNKNVVVYRLSDKKLHTLHLGPGEIKLHFGRIFLTNKEYSAFVKNYNLAAGNK